MPVESVSGTRIFNMPLAAMACEARVSCNMVLGDLGSVKADGFTAGGGEREARIGGAGGCA